MSFRPSAFGSLSGIYNFTENFDAQIAAIDAHSDNELNFLMITVIVSLPCNHQQLTVHTQRARVTDTVRLAHASAKRDGKVPTVARWIKMRYNACPTALDMVHSIWIRRAAIAKQNGAAMTARKVNDTRHKLIHFG